MQKVTYTLTVGNWSVSSADDPKTELLALDTQLALDAPGDYGRITVYAPPTPQPGLLEQAVGAAVSAASSALGLGGSSGAEEEAFTVQVRGQSVKLGDRMTSTLAVDEQSATVLTAESLVIQSTFGQTTITARTGMQKLASTRLNQVYQNYSLGQVVQDLCGQADVATGNVATGSTYPYLVVHESKNLLRTIRELAAREGMEVYFDTENKLIVQKFAKTEADHTLYYGIDLLNLEVFNYQPLADHLLVYGESPASNQGSDAWHWLVKDLSPCRSEVGQGAKTLALQDGAVRTKDAADAAAAAKFGAMKDQAASGRLKILGKPTVQVGDAVTLKNVPKPEMNGLFKVISVRHVYNKREGYVTYVGFSGQGGAKKAAGLLGQLGRALAGATGALGL
jgi:hypothetical protein